MRNLIILAVLAISILSLHSCKDQFDFSMENLSTNVEQKSDFAIPLINASITLEEILPDDEDADRFLIVDPDGFLRLEYVQDVKAVSASDFFEGQYSGNPVPPISYSISPQIVELGFDKLLNEGEFYIANPKLT